MDTQDLDLRGVVKPAPGPLPFSVKRWEPCEVLKPYVHWFWSVRYALEPGRHFEQFTLPHPVVHLTLEDGDGTVTGPMSGRFERVLEGAATILGVRFRPAMFGTFVGDLWSLRDQRLAAEAIPGLSTVHQALVEASGGDDEGLERQQRALEAWLRRALPANVDPALTTARDWVERLSNDQALTDVASAAAAFGVSSRTLQRQMRQRVGWTPSEVIRRRRIQDAVAQVADAIDRPGGLADLALRLGYCDQAHLCRDFKGLTGVTPTEYAARHR